MNIAILTFEGFNELDSFIAAGILNRMKEFGWNVQITSPTQFVTSMNGVKIEAQQQLEFANNADVVLFGSGIFTRDIAKDKTILDRLSLNSNKQLICAQCSGTLILSVLGLLNDLPACTEKENIATAGGCMASSYLSTWIITKLAGVEKASSAIHYVSPVGEKEENVKHCLEVITPYL